MERLPSAPRVAVVSESLARSLAPDGDVVGRVIRYGTSPATARLTIVGVAGNLSLGNFRQNAVRIVFTPAIQAGETAFATLQVRTDGDPMRLAQAATAAVIGLGRETVSKASTVDELFGNGVVAERMGATITSVGAGLSLILACLGVYALLAHSVARRTREIGIRIAVGATPAAVSRMVVGDAVRLVLAGLALGLPAAVGAASILRALLYKVTTTDGATLAAAAALLLAAAVAASVHPAIRAFRVDPATTLRAD